MGIGGDVVDQPLREQAQGECLHGASEGARHRHRRHRAQDAALNERREAVGLAQEGGRALRMGEDGSKAAHLQVEQRSLEQRGRVSVGALDQEVATAAEAQLLERCVIQLHRLRHRHLPSPQDLHFDLRITERRSQLAEAFGDQLDGKWMVVSDVGRGDYGEDSGCLGGASQAKGSLDRRGPVVEARQDVAVEIDQGRLHDTATGTTSGTAVRARCDRRAQVSPGDDVVAFRGMCERQGGGQMRLKRRLRTLLATGSLVGVFGISGQAGALVSTPVAVPPAPELPSVPVPQVLVRPESPAMRSVSEAATAGVSSISSRGPTLQVIPQLHSELTGDDDDGPARLAARSDSGASGSPDPVPSGRSANPPQHAISDSTGSVGSGSGGTRTVAFRQGAITAGPTATQIGREPARRHAAAERRLRRTVESLSGCLSSLPSLEATVLALRAGLGAGAPLSTSQVGGRLGVSPTAVRNAERQGLRGLQQANAATGCGAPAQGHTGGFTFRADQPVLGALGSGMVAERGSSPRSVGDNRHAAKDVSASGRRGDRTQRGRSGRPVAASRDSVAASTGSSEDCWLLVILGLAGLTAMVVVLARRRSAARRVNVEPQRRRQTSRSAMADLTCSYCQRRRIAVNPTHGVYHCAQCGFRGTLPPAVVAELANMHQERGRSTHGK